MPSSSSPSSSPLIDVALYTVLIFPGIIRSPYDILDLEPSAKADDVKRKYRQISLCALLLSCRIDKKRRSVFADAQLSVRP